MSLVLGDFIHYFGGRYFGLGAADHAGLDAPRLVVPARRARRSAPRSAPRPPGSVPRDAAPQGPGMRGRRSSPGLAPALYFPFFFSFFFFPFFSFFLPFLPMYFFVFCYIPSVYFTSSSVSPPLLLLSALPL